MVGICTCASAHVQIFPGVSYVGCADCAEIWSVVRDQLAMHFTLLRGRVHLHVRTPFPYLGNGWPDCAEIWYAVRDQLARQFIHTRDGVHLHVRSCVPLFHISGTAGRIALKFGMLLGTS